MAPEEVLELNGDFKDSPLLATVRRLHAAFSSLGSSYAVVGGLAVLRNGAPRTTIDVDILTTKEGWDRFRRSSPGGFSIKTDSAVDERNGVAIDVLFSGDDWDMVIPLPDPEAAAEYDAGLGGNFLSLLGCLELKTAVFLQKEKEYGRELAAKDLADVTALLQANEGRIEENDLKKLHPAIYRELHAMREKLNEIKRRRGKKPSGKADPHHP